MNAWPFVIAAFGVTGVGTAGLLLWAWLGMRRAERRADSLARRP